MKKLQLAAESGDAGAQFNLGVMLHGQPVPAGQAVGQNRDEALAWLLKSALQGLPRAHAKLAEVYASPPVAPGDEVRACTWLLVAVTSSSGIHLRRAETEYERLAATLRPGQLRQARRDARAIVKAFREQTIAAA